MRCYFCGHKIGKDKGNSHYVYGKHKGPKVWSHKSCHKKYHKEVQGDEILKIDITKLAEELNDSQNIYK